MRAAKRKHGQRIRIVPDKRDLARSALAFGRSGGCSAGCELCRFVYLCEGGDIGAGELGGEDEREASAEGERTA